MGYKHMSRTATTAIGEAQSLMEYGDEGSDKGFPDVLPALL